MILLSYDGSAGAQAAIDSAARLMPGSYATVLTVWEPFGDRLVTAGSAGAGFALSGTMCDVQAIDEARHEQALATATAGADLAIAAGLLAQPLTARSHAGLAHTILGAAEEIDADLVVLGTRGRSGVASLLLGSTSHAVIQHSDRAVLVVPSQAVVAHRRDWVHMQRSVTDAQAVRS